MKANVSIQILPTAPDDQEIVRIVDEVIAYIRSTGLHYFVGPTETAVEGDDFHQLMEIVENCVLIANRAGSEKVSAYVKLIYRSEGEVLGIEEKTGKHQH